MVSWEINPIALLMGTGMRNSEHQGTAHQMGVSTAGNTVLNNGSELGLFQTPQPKEITPLSCFLPVPEARFGFSMSVSFEFQQKQTGAPNPLSLEMPKIT